MVISSSGSEQQRRGERERDCEVEREAYCREDKVYFSVFIFGITFGDVRI